MVSEHISIKTSLFHIEAAGAVAIVIIFTLLTSMVTWYFLDRMTVTLSNLVSAQIRTTDKMVASQAETMCVLATPQVDRRSAITQDWCREAVHKRLGE